MSAESFQGDAGTLVLLLKLVGVGGGSGMGCPLTSLDSGEVPSLPLLPAQQEA